MTINSISDFRAAVRNGPYAWPGGYPLYYVTTDGAALCADCMTKERASIVRSTFENSRDGLRDALRAFADRLGDAGEIVNTPHGKFRWIEEQVREVGL